MKKLTLIKDLVSGSTITDVFLLTSATQGQAKNGPYWRLELRDASGSISGKVWSPLSLEYTEMPIGEFLQISARVSSYRDKLEFAVTGIHILSEKEKAQLSLADFIPSSPFNPASMMQELKELCKKELKYKPWHDFIFGILDDKEISKRMLIFPAAKAMHHAYAGGLLEHTLSVCRLCQMLSNHYPCLDRQLLIAGAICHDLGKIWELTSGVTIDYTDEGRLIGHISLVIERIKPFISSAKLDDSLVLHLNHLILSHHGTLEFGSPKVPSTPEAMMLHYADNIDAKMQQMQTALASVGEEAGWSPYVPALERFLYQAASTPTNCISSEETANTPLHISNPVESDQKVSVIDAMLSDAKESSIHSLPSERLSGSEHIFEKDSYAVENTTPNEQFSTFESSFIEGNSYDNEELPAFLYEETCLSDEEKNFSTQKEGSSSAVSYDITSNNRYKDSECSQENTVSISNDIPHEADYPQKRDTILEKKSDDSDTTHRVNVTKNEGLQEVTATLLESSDCLDEVDNSTGNVHKRDSFNLEENSDIPDNSGVLDDSESSLSLDSALTVETAEEKTKSTNLQTLSLLDHCL